VADSDQLRYLEERGRRYLFFIANAAKEISVWVSSGTAISEDRACR
jgi:hypothetical protein